DGTVTHTRRICEGRNDIMSTGNVKALCFDTGGTILDWHTGIETKCLDVARTHDVIPPFANASRVGDGSIGAPERFM
ncbi:MAG: hypothetical protein ACLPKW_22985, partial [Acetobacteraceae bacterium]